MIKKRALIIGTEFATNGIESGGALRVNGIKDLLESLSFIVRIVSRKNATELLRQDWDLVVLVSFATAKFLRRARKSSNILWFDPTDSWQMTHYSLIRSGSLRQIPILIRDLFWLWTAPRIDLLTFVTRRDAQHERAWWRDRLAPLIYPVHNLRRTINPSLETRFVFVGDGRYRPNTRAIKFLSKVLDFLPVSQQIQVYGRGFEGLDSRFVLHGYCPNEEMYFENDIHLAPMKSGSGLKLKVAVPLANGLKVISTLEGANGFSKNQNLITALNEESFAAKMLQLKGSQRLAKPILRADIYEDDDTALILNWININTNGLA
jgi:hypothetical protein